MSLDLTTPYSNQELDEVVSLYPYQMDNDILIHLKNNLKLKVEKKCNKYGYITFVHKITNSGNGQLDANNLSGNAVYNVKYLANICIPINNTQIIIQMDIIDSKIIKGINGPIICIILIKNINLDNFKIKNNGEIEHIESNRVLKKGDYVKVNILANQYNANDTKINVIGWLENLADDTNINDYLLPKYDNDEQYLNDSFENITINES
jgi:DNA-directed RNA polymerase subunit E'/Rpb7